MTSAAPFLLTQRTSPAIWRISLSVIRPPAHLLKERGALLLHTLGAQNRCLTKRNGRHFSILDGIQCGSLMRVRVDLPGSWGHPRSASPGRHSVIRACAFVSSARKNGRFSTPVRRTMIKTHGIRTHVERPLTCPIQKTNETLFRLRTK
jgi:hypothetical protein